VPIILTATKIDLRDNVETLSRLTMRKQAPVTAEQGEALAQETECTKYLECSALTQKGLADLFTEAIRAAITARNPTNKKGKKDAKKAKCTLL